MFFLLYFTAFFPSIVQNCFFGVFPGAVKRFSFGFGGLLLSLYVVAQSMCVGSFVRVFEFLSMPTTRPTFNSLSADLFPVSSTSAPPSSGASVAVSTVASGTLNSLPNEIVVAVAQALQQSLLTFLAEFRAENHAALFFSAALPPVSSVVSSDVSSVVSSDVSSVVSSSAMVAASSLSFVAGTLRLSPFVSTFPAISSTPSSCSACLAWSITAPIMASQVTSFSSHGESLAASCNKAFVVGQGHAPIPAKLVKKITNDEFVELADLLSTNLHAVNLESQTFLDGKLLVVQKVSAS